ncbi:MAG: ABC transporter substrate-binding protein [Candidatus Rokuibacteriota bacterium]
MSHRAGPFVTLATVLAIVVLGAAGLGYAGALTPQEEKLVAAARKEGAVVFINPLFSDETAARLGPAFIKRYGLGPDFQFNNLRKGTGATVAQVRQEIQAGKLTVDVHMVSAPGFFDEAAKRGAFEALDSGHWKDHTALLEKAGQYANYPYVVVPLAYTFQPVWNSSCPGMANVKVDSYADTVQPALKGKTISPDITKSFTYTNTTVSLIESGFDMNAFWDKLKATDPIVEFRTEPKMQMVISCERPFDMWNLSGRVYQNVVKKPDLAKVLKIGSYKEGQVMLGNQAAVLKGAPHPNAGKLLIEFLLSKEGADIFVETEGIYTFLKDYTPPPAARPYLLDLNKHKLLGLKDWVAAQGKFKAVRDAWLNRFK